MSIFKTISRIFSKKPSEVPASSVNSEKKPLIDETLTGRIGAAEPGSQETLTQAPPNKSSPDQTLTGGLVHTPERDETITGGLGALGPAITLTKMPRQGAGELIDKVEWEIGDRIDGKYEVKEVIGQGGMGSVCKVRHMEWNIDMAVKMPLTDLVADEQSKHRFIREAQTWVDLGLHPNIVQCYYVRDIGGIPRIFMDYLKGGSLKDWIKAGKAKPGDWETILDLMIQACDGLAYAHEKGLVHRDVKPANILFSEDGRLCITDFGLVKLTAAEDLFEDAKGPATEIPRSHTISGALMGTPEYGAPEQWMDASKVDATADIYSLGVVFYELCCGRRPFDTSESKEPAHVIIGRHITSDLIDPRQFFPEIPGNIVKLLFKCLSREPEARPKSMSIMRDSLLAAHGELTGRDYYRAKPEAALLRAEELNNKAVSFYDLGLDKDAMEAFTQADNISPLHPAVSFNINLLRWRAGEITTEIMGKRILALTNSYPADYALKLLTGMFYIESGALPEALPFIKRYSARINDAFATRILEFIKTATDVLDRSKIYLEGHGNTITSVCFSPDGNYLLSGSRDRRLRYWDIKTQKSVRRFKGHEDEVLCVDISPGGKLAVSGSSGGSIRLWDINTGECIWKREAHRAQKDETYYEHGDISAKFSPSGEKILTGGQDGNICIWDLKGELSARMADPGGPVKSVSYGLDDTTCISTCNDGRIRIWDIINQQLINECEGHKGYVNDAAISFDGRWIVSGGLDSSLRQWDLVTGEQVRELTGHKEKIKCVSLFPLSNKAVSGSFDMNIRMWDLQTGACTRRYEIATNALAVSPDEAWMAVGEDHLVCLYHIASPFCSSLRLVKPVDFRVLGRRKDSFNALLEKAKEFYNNKRYAQCLEAVKEARTIPGYERDSSLLDIKYLLPLNNIGINYGRLMTLHDTDVPMSHVAISPDGRTCAVGGSRGFLQLFSFPHLKPLKQYDDPGASISAIKFDPSGNTMVTANYDGTSTQWNVKTGERLNVFDARPAHTIDNKEYIDNDGARYKKAGSWNINDLDLSPDGLMAATACSDNEIHIWNLQTSNLRKTFHNPEERQDGFLGRNVHCVAFTSDSKYIAAGYEDKNVRIWDLDKGACIWTGKGHRLAVKCLAFNSTCSILATGDDFSTIRLWRTDSGECLKVLEGHRGPISSVSFSQDDEWLISTGADSSIKIWNFSTGQCALTLQGHEDKVSCADFGFSLRYVVSVGYDRRIIIWELDFEGDIS